MISVCVCFFFLHKYVEIRSKLGDIIFSGFLEIPKLKDAVLFLIHCRTLRSQEKELFWGEFANSL